MKRKPVFPLFLSAVLCLPIIAGAQVAKGKYLYTAPDPTANGSIRGKIVNPQKMVVGVFVLPPDEPRFVYKADLSGKNNSEFNFTGLPMAKYDLLILFDDCFYEGLTLTREEDSLTTKDRDLIEQITNKTDPFFEKKEIHRLAGKSGKGEKARGICTFCRFKSSEEWSGEMHYEPRRSLKLLLLMDVGPGWQMERTREIHCDFVKKENAMLKHHYMEDLGGIRVTDSLKDLGEIDLTKPIKRTY